MLDKLVLLLKRGGTLTVDQMARELDTTPEVVSGMIDHMTRHGWLHAMSASCDSTCSACVLARDCARMDRQRIWLASADTPLH